MKKQFTRILIIALSLIFALVTLLHFAPANFDSGACGGGFRAWIMRKQSPELIAVFLDKQKNNSSTKYILTYDLEEFINNTTWHGRILKTKGHIIYNDKTYNVEYEGTRYWIEKYSWKMKLTPIKRSRG